MKFIIDNQSDCSDEHALELAMDVVGLGKISESAYGSQYCYHTRFKDGHSVSVFKRKSGTQRFLILNGGS